MKSTDLSSFGVRILMRFTMVLLGSALGPALQAAEPPPVPNSPQPIVRAYMQAMKKGDLDAAMKLTAKIEGLSAENVRSGLAGYARTLSEQDVATIFHESRATQDCALVIVEQRRPRVRTQPSILPVMLVLREKEWKVLPKLNPELRKQALTRHQMDQIRVLGKWFYERIGEMELRSKDEYGKKLAVEKRTLTGSWQRADAGAITALKLKADGAFERVVVREGGLAGRRNGRWTVADKQLALEFAGVGSGASKLEKHRVVAVMLNLMGLESHEGESRIWRRIPDGAYRSLIEGVKDRTVQ